MELRKALDTTASTTGNMLLPYDLDPTLNEELLKLQPLAELIPVVQAEGKTHEYTIRTSHPMGWFEGESTGANNKNSTYARKSTMLKIQRIWGSVTGFAQAMDERFIDALSTELEGSLEGMSNLLEFSVLYGAADDLGFAGDPYQFSGLFTHIFKNAPGNVIDAGGTKPTLDVLDQGVAKIAAFRQTRQDPKMWMMGLRMRQIVDGLQTRIQIPLTSTSLQDGRIVMANYFGAPIFESDYVVPSGVVSPTPTAAAPSGTGSAFTGGTGYKWRIASVTMFGEQVGSVASGSQTPTAGQTVGLSWTADANANLYYIFRQSGGTGDYQLVDIIAAKTYDAAGAVTGNVNSYTDIGKAAIAIKPLEAGEQNIVLLNRHADRGVALMGKVDDMGRQIKGLVSFVELARIKDTYDYMLKSYLGMRVKYPNVAAAIIRHAKVA